MFGRRPGGFRGRGNAPGFAGPGIFMNVGAGGPSFVFMSSVSGGGGPLGGSYGGSLCVDIVTNVVTSPSAAMSMVKPVPAHLVFCVCRASSYPHHIPRGCFTSDGPSVHELNYNWVPHAAKYARQHSRLCWGSEGVPRMRTKLSLTCSDSQAPL